MQHHEFLDLSQQVWDEAYEQHRRSFHVVPKPLTPEQASALFAKAVRTSALSLLYMYANSVRSQQGLCKIRQPPLPAGLQQWIDRQITAADAAFHNPGAQAFQSIANDLLSQLRAVEHLFINHPEED